MKNIRIIDDVIILDGVIIYNDFNIDESISFQKQQDSFKEDILQIAFGERYTLDVDWYPEADPSGYYWIRGVQDSNWQAPIMSIKCRSIFALKEAIEKVAAVLSSRNAN